MNHNRLEPLIEGICYAYDYGSNSHMKATELKEQLFPLGSQVDTKTGLEALYGIISVSLKLIEELECSNVINVEESSRGKVDLPFIPKAVK